MSISLVESMPRESSTRPGRDRVDPMTPIRFRLPLGAEPIALDRRSHWSRSLARLASAPSAARLPRPPSEVVEGERRPAARSTSPTQHRARSRRSILVLDERPATLRRSVEQYDSAGRVVLLDAMRRGVRPPVDDERSRHLERALMSAQLDVRSSRRPDRAAVRRPTHPELDYSTVAAAPASERHGRQFGGRWTDGRAATRSRSADHPVSDLDRGRRPPLSVRTSTRRRRLLGH